MGSKIKIEVKSIGLSLFRQKVKTTLRPKCIDVATCCLISQRKTPKFTASLLWWRRQEETVIEQQQKRLQRAEIPRVLKMQELEREVTVHKENCKYLRIQIKQMEQKHKEDLKIQKNQIEQEHEKEKEEMQEKIEHTKAQYKKLKRVTEEQKELIMSFAKVVHSRDYGNYFDEDPDKATEEKLKEAEKTVEALKEEKKNIAHLLSQKNKENETLKERIDRFRLLFCPNNSKATLAEIEREICKAVEIKDLNMTKEELLEEIAGIKKTRDRLEANVDSLKRDQELIEFELRNAMAKATRLTGRRVVSPLYFAGSHPEMRQKAIRSMTRPGIYPFNEAEREARPKTATGAATFDSVAIPMSVVRAHTAAKTSAKTTPVYCILCRKNVNTQSLESFPCEIHRDALNCGIWSCCRKKKEGRGCFVARHCYLIKSSDSKHVIISTDQEQKIEI